MKSSKKVINILGVIGAVLFSILLVILLVLTPVVSAGTSFFRAKNIHKVITSVDYSQIIMFKLGEESTEEIPALGNELMNQLMETEMMKEIVEMCVDNVFKVIEGDSDEENITADEIMTVADRHIDELKEILKGYIGNTIPLTDEILEEMTRLVVKEYSVMVADMIPTAEDLGLDSEVLNVILNLRNGTYFWIVFGIVAGLTILVFLCQIARFKGFLWIGVDYFVATVLSTVASIVMKNLDLVMLSGEGTIGATVLSAMQEIISSEMQKGAGVLAILGVVFITVFVVRKKMIRKKCLEEQREVVGA